MSILFALSGVGLASSLILGSFSYAADVTYGTQEDSGGTASEAIECKTLDTTNNYWVCCYEDIAAGKCVAETISGTDITQGTAATFAADISVGEDSRWYTIGIAPLSTTKFAISYPDDGQAQDGYTDVGTVTWGNPSTITYTGAVEFETTDMECSSATALDSDEWAIAYNDEGSATVDTLSWALCTDSGGISCTVTASGTDYAPCQISVELISSDDFVTCFREVDDTNNGNCVVNTWAGNGNQTFTAGTAQEFDTGSIFTIDVCTPYTYGQDAAASDKFIVVFRDSGEDPSQVSLYPATVSTRTITFGSEVNVDSGQEGNTPRCSFVDDTRFIVSWNDRTDEGAGDTDVSSVLCTATWATPSVSCNSEEVVTSELVGGESQYYNSVAMDTLSGWGGNTPKIGVGFITADDDNTVSIAGNLNFAARRIMLVD